MRAVALLVLGAFAALLASAAVDLPPLGDPEAAASVYVAAEYVERSYADTKTPNVVTAILADYRGFDTLGETTVVVTAALACLAILRGREPEPPGS